VMIISGQATAASARTHWLRSHIVVKLYYLLVNLVRIGIVTSELVILTISDIVVALK
jgi:hypothetical protein